MDGSGPESFLLVLDDVVVAGDIGELLRERFAGAEITVERDLDRATVALDRRPFAVVLVAKPLRLLRGTPFEEAVRRQGTRVVVLNGNESSDQQAETGWTFVTRPYAEDKLIAALWPAGR